MRMTTLGLIVLAVTTFLLSQPVAAGDPSKGATIFKKRCTTCHAIGPNAPNKVGPELNGLFGRPAGSVPNYNYSKANRESGIIWTEEIFATYIRDPRATVPGTKMPFSGLKNDQEVADLVAYLGSFAADGSSTE